ncbi:MAG: IS66 family insertion sequence element accessory protein TnpB [Alphaproteobacteria bacterium]|nr:IS66 family insertion sequence element accessory protein TnpB [Alphaproteobacteria bacterium]
MIGFGSHLRFFLYRQAADMRKGFDGLSGLVADELGRDPASGDVYVFINRRRDRMKLLIWEEEGFWLLYHRLEAGTFQLPGSANAREVAISYEQLLWLLRGIEVLESRQRRRYKSGKTADIF